MPAIHGSKPYYGAGNSVQDIKVSVHGWTEIIIDQSKGRFVKASYADAMGCFHHGVPSEDGFIFQGDAYKYMGTLEDFHNERMGYDVIEHEQRASHGIDWVIVIIISTMAILITLSLVKCIA